MYISLAHAKMGEIQDVFDKTSCLVAGFISNHYVRLFCRIGSYLKLLHIAVVSLLKQQTVSKNMEKYNMGEVVLILIFFSYVTLVSNHSWVFSTHYATIATLRQNKNSVRHGYKKSN